MLRYAILQALFIIQFCTKKAHSTACFAINKGNAPLFSFYSKCLLRNFIIKHFSLPQSFLFLRSRASLR